MSWEYIIAMLIVLVVFPLIGMGFSYLRQKSKGTKWGEFLERVYTFVNAAEHMYKAGELDDRLDYVTKGLDAWLAKNNIKLDAETLFAYIKAEVNNLPPTHELV